jgi:hypothetical protein
VTFSIEDQRILIASAYLPQETLFSTGFPDQFRSLAR